MEDPQKGDRQHLSRTLSRSVNHHVEPMRRSDSISIPMNCTCPYENDTILMGHCDCLSKEKRNVARTNGTDNCELDSHIQQRDGESRSKMLDKLSSVNDGKRNDWLDDKNAVRNDHLMRSRHLGMYYNSYGKTSDHTANQANNSKFSRFISPQFNVVYGNAKGLATRLYSFLYAHTPGVINPHDKAAQQWNRFFIIACLVAIFVDPLFFFLLSADQELSCIDIQLASSSTTQAIITFRSMTDVVYFLHILLQFRLAFVAPESRVVGAGEVVEHPKKIALNYLTGYFLIDIFNVIPLPQIIILFVLPKSFDSSSSRAGANSAKNMLRASILVQYLPRLCRFLTLLAGQTPSGFIFESAWANFIINLFMFVLSAHVVGSCWYLFGLQRVNQCLRDACHGSNLTACMRFIDCGYKNSFFSDPTWRIWADNDKATGCFDKDTFPYGIYGQAVKLTTESFIHKYVYSLFWGFQQISTLAGNQTPSYFIWEVLFTMAIIGLGLLLFALLIGNMQHFLQALGQRRLEMSLRQRDYERWMNHRCLPEELRRQVRSAERYNWAATRGVNEELLLEKLPEELQRDIRRHLFKFVKKVRIFSMMDDQVIDAICERLKLKIFIEESKILYPGGPIEKMIFIIRGKLESVEDKTTVSLSEGDVCGEELLTWCLEKYSVNRIADGRKVRIAGQRLLSDRTVRCLTNVEAFALQVADLKEVTSLFARFLRNQRVQGAIRYESPYWRAFAAKRIQVAWRYWKRRQTREHSSPESNH